MIIRTITEACRASVADTSIVRISAFASDTGVPEMVTWPILATGNAVHLVNGNGRIVSSTIWKTAMPIFPLHHTDYTPGESLGEIPGPDAGSMCFFSCELSMLAVASLWKASACEASEVIGQIVVAVNKLCWLLDWKTLRVPLTKLTLVKSSG